MRSKLLLIVGLAVLGACVVAGTAGAGGGSVVGVGEGGVQINIPDGGDLDQVQVLPQCSNTADDDGDGITDLADPDCTGPLDATESGTSGVPDAADHDRPRATTDDGGRAERRRSRRRRRPRSRRPPRPSPTATVGPTGDGGRGIEPSPTAAVASPKPRPQRRPTTRTTTRPAAPARRWTRRPTATPTARPTDTNPSVTIADFGPAPIGVPNFVIDQFTIPPFLLPIYQACGTQYGIPWQVLASINRIETAFGTNLNVSTAGALGWMQFMPATWEMYGVDANDDGRKDPYNPVDAICAAARYLNAAGGDDDLRTAIFAYNHADWYVDEVLLYANQYGKLPETLVSSLTGLTEGAHFPVAANARYADDISERRALERSKPGKARAGNAAEVISGSTHTSRDQHLLPRGRPGRRGQRRRRSPRSASRRSSAATSSCSDAYGNRFTYAELGEVSDAYPVPKEQQAHRPRTSSSSPPTTRRPTEPRQRRHARSTTRRHGGQRRRGRRQGPADERRRGRRLRAADDAGPVNTEDARERLYAYPERKQQRRPRRTSPASSTRCSRERMPGYESFKGYLANVLRFDPKKMDLRPLREGSKVTAGHRARPDRRDRRARPARPLRDPPGRPRRAEDRPEADPRRLEAARGDRDLPRRRQEPVRRHRDRQPGAADVEDAADRAGRSTTRASRSTPAGARTSAPARSTAGCWRCSSTWSPAAST